MKPKLFRVTTVPESLKILLKGQHGFMTEHGFDVIGVSSAGNALNEVGEEEKISVFEVKMSRKITPIKDLLSVYRLYKLIKKEKPIIVHTHTPKAGTVGMIASKIAGVPHRLHTIAGLPLLEATGNKRRLLNLVEKLTYACATRIYPNSNGLKNIIIREKFCNSNKLKVIANGSSNGINTKYFNPEIYSSADIVKFKDNFGIEKDDFIFIFVGRLVGDKGINELIEAFNKLLLESTKIKLLLVGGLESELDPLFPLTLKEIETNRNIISVGHQIDVRPYFSISDVLVFPSYREGFPNVVMQAGAMGLPCIVSNINGCNEIIEEGINGTIIPTKDVESLLFSMRKIMMDEFWRNQLALNARFKIVTRFEQQMVWDSLLSEYLILLT